MFQTCRALEGANGLDIGHYTGTALQKKKNLRCAIRAPQVWWERVDSNHRSQRQQIYSLPPLATRELSRLKRRAIL